jgi:hypothetical protein
MAEEKQTELIDDTLSADDMDVLREVLESDHTRGIAPVSLFNQADVLAIDSDKTA